MRLLLRYFTVWSLCVAAVGPADVARAAAAATALAGLYLTYIHPRRLPAFDRDRGRPIAVLHGPALRAVDLLFHQLPLAAAIARGRHPRRPFLTPAGIWGALALYAAYAAALHPQTVADRYDLAEREWEGLFLAVVSALVLGVVLLPRGL